MKSRIFMKKKSISMILCVLSALLLLCACAGGGNAGNPETETAAEDSVTLLESLRNYTIVRPDIGRDGEMQAAKRIREAFGTDAPQLKTDWVNTKAGEVIPSGGCEILIGATNRALSEKAEAILRERGNCGQDYVILFAENEIALCAGGDDALAQAVTRFLDELLPASAGKFPAGYMIHETVSYPMTAFCGNLDVSMLYVEADEGLGAQKTRLAAGLSALTGYAVCEKPSDAKTVVRLTLDPALGENDYRVVHESADTVVLSTGHALSMDALISELLDVSRPQSGEDQSGTITVTIPLRYGDRVLVWNDEFDGTELDEDKWERCPEWSRQDAGGYWNDGESYLDGEGHLVLRASLAEDGTPISGAVRTFGKFSQVYGYYECRMKFNTQHGFWGAFWMMCGNVASEQNRGVDGMEIDIIETGGIVWNQVNHALHWDGYGSAHQSSAMSFERPDLYDSQFHVIGFEWTETEYIFYIDGEETWRTSDGGICTEPGYIKLTTEFGTWAGSYDPAKLPDVVEVDYVRVYR